MKTESRKRRARRQALLRAGVWAFLILFAFSVVGMIGGLSVLGGLGH